MIGLVAMMGSVFTMCQGGQVPKDCCKSGDRLDIVMTKGTTRDRVNECNRMGGELIAHRKGSGWVLICEGVDF